MNPLIPLVGITVLLGSALVGGVFFAFSSFVMKALARVPSPEGIAAMQSINVVIDPNTKTLKHSNTTPCLGARRIEYKIDRSKRH